jgi:hypothetical protein
MRIAVSTNETAVIVRYRVAGKLYSQPNTDESTTPPFEEERIEPGSEFDTGLTTGEVFLSSASAPIKASNTYFGD